MHNLSTRLMIEGSDYRVSRFMKHRTARALKYGTASGGEEVFGRHILLVMLCWSTERPSNAA